MPTDAGPQSNNLVFLPKLDEINALLHQHPACAGVSVVLAYESSDMYSDSYVVHLMQPARTGSSPKYLSSVRIDFNDDAPGTATIESKTSPRYESLGYNTLLRMAVVLIAPHLGFHQLCSQAVNPTSTYLLHHKLGFSFAGDDAVAVAVASPGVSRKNRTWSHYAQLHADQTNRTGSRRGFELSLDITDPANLAHVERELRRFLDDGKIKCQPSGGGGRSRRRHRPRRTRRKRTRVA